MFNMGRSERLNNMATERQGLCMRIAQTPTYYSIHTHIIVPRHDR